MTVAVTAKITRPEDVDVTLTITMPVSQWDKVQEEFAGCEKRMEQPFWNLRDRIEKVLRQIRDTAYERIEP